MSVILAIDQGTTSTKALAVNSCGDILGASTPGRFAIEPRYPQHGWVEYDPQQMLAPVRDSAHDALDRAQVRTRDVIAVGLANQG
jgi:glycerol kinase